MRSSACSRRQFIEMGAAALTAPLILSQRSGAQRVASPNDRINVGVIGVGMQGRGHASSFAQLPDVHVIAVCDVESTRRDAAQKSVNGHYAEQKKSGRFTGCAVYTDYREMLDRDDLDAVVIATPDHGHAIPCIQAAKRRKHIYCEKPLTITVREGRLIAQAAEENRIIFQTGSQQRSEFDGRFRLAVELVRNGRLGKLTKITIGVGGPAMACDLPVEPQPDDVNWDLWLGPAAWRGYNSILCPKGNHNHFPDWRRYREFGGGGLADMGAHHFDIAQWALDMDQSGPVRIEPPSGDATSGLKFVYSNGVEMYHGGPDGCTFEGTRGKLYVNRPILQAEPAGLVEEPLGDDAVRVYHANDHRRNWIECVRNDRPCICPAEVGHRSATVCHLGNIAYRLRRALDWDPRAEVFVNDDEANQLLSYEPRQPWTYS
jgi:predicted dehydrogenase